MKNSDFKDFFLQSREETLLAVFEKACLLKYLTTNGKSKEYVCKYFST